MADRLERTELLEAALAKRILVLDGAMGTAIQALSPTDADFGGSTYAGCNEFLILTKPALIEQIHRAYLEAGADILETDTFGGTALVLQEFELASRAAEINFEAARLARRLADSFSTAAKPRFVAGSMGPTTKAISVTGGVTFDELIAQFRDQAKALVEGGVDYLLLETCQDTRNVKAGLIGIQEYFAQAKVKVPIAVSCTIEPMGTMLAGQTVDAFAVALSHVDLLYLGLNCATGPVFMTDHIRTLAQVTRARVACVPNAGLPDEDGIYLETPASMAKVIAGFCTHGWINLIGGCCGTRAEHIKGFTEMATHYAPRQGQPKPVSRLSGFECFEVTEEKRPILVGERTNVVGSRKFQRLIREDAFDEASEIARAQVKNGAHIIDVCMADPDREEMTDMDRFMSVVTKKVRAPFMIDSTDAAVMECGLIYCQGKALLNSINLEDGEERFEKVVPLARKYGAALVVGCIDEDPIQGMAVTVERKRAVARRSFDLLTGKYGVQPEDIYFDALVFPCGTGDAQYRQSAPATIDGVRAIKQDFPLSKTVLGISNVSFGLPEAGREVLNSVFLYHCTKAGLDLAIVNSEKLKRYPSIPDEEKLLCDNLLWNRSPQALMAFSDYFRKAKAIAAPKETLSLDERLARYIVEGTRDGLIDDLVLALKQSPPLDIINGPLMKGMEEVGRLFNKNELIVAEVLQSAESMKVAVSYLEPFMEKTESASRGRVLLATVKGDVHDIGKNLVEIILKNNGFDVINLGIKIPPEQLIAAVRKHRPDIIGLSGLLVKSAQQMVATAEDLRRSGIDVPILVGGAALSRNFVDKRISVAYEGTVEYADDAMHGLDLAKRIRDPGEFTDLRQEIEERRRQLGLVVSPAASAAAPVKVGDGPKHLSSFPTVPDFERHVLKDLPPDEIWPFINPLMLYGNHLGMKGSVVRKLMQGLDAQSLQDPVLRKAAGFRDLMEELKTQGRQGAMKLRAIYRFYSTAAQGNQVFLYADHQSQEPVATFDFPRQSMGQGLSLADYVAPAPVGAPRRDSVCLTVATAGEGISNLAQEFKVRGEYLKSHAIQALAVESAEALTEWLHSRIRGLWGYPDSPTMTMMERFQAKYHGKRYSFGYPACPELADQEKLFALLKPEEIGVRLTDGYMMEPEASVSSIVFHHEEAVYFGVGRPEETP